MNAYDRRKLALLTDCNQSIARARLDIIRAQNALTFLDDDRTELSEVDNELSILQRDIKLMFQRHLGSTK